MLLKDLATSHSMNPALRQPGAAPVHQHRHSRAGAAGAGITTLALSVLDPMSVLTNAADEMTQSLSSKVQERSVRERRVSVGSSLEELSRERLLALMKHLQAGQGGTQEGGNPHDLLELARRILKQPGFARQMVKEQGGDPSMQYLTLLEVAELIRDGSAGADPAGLAYQLVREAAEQLMAEHGDYVRADLNTAEVSAGLGSAQESAAFRSAYRDCVLASETLADTLQHLLKVVSAGEGTDLDKVLESMKIALGADLAAARPSTESVKLQYLVSDLYHLKVISTVIDHCDKLGKTLQVRHGLPAFKASALASDLVALSNERWVDSSRVGRLADRYGAQKDPSCKVDFLSGARESLRQMPTQVFSAPENRQSLLDAAQMAIDDAIDQEMGA